MSGWRPGRRTLFKIAAGFLLVPASTGRSAAAAPRAFRIRNRYSKLNRKRPLRPYTRYIVLHTTEGAEAGALAKVRRYGETNYFVCKSGTVYRIIDKERIAKHAGRSMWDGLTTIDNYALGIEVVGYHNKDIRDAQYDALRELLRQLQELYDIPDDRVLTHSMVAYGSPNRFHHYNHRTPPPERSYWSGTFMGGMSKPAGPRRVSPEGSGTIRRPITATPTEPCSAGTTSTRRRLRQEH